jgi:hypothetical protein
MSRRYILSAVATLLASFGCFSAYAEDAQMLDDFVWARIKATGEVVALSRNDPSFNYFDIGDFALDSRPLVEKSLNRLATAAGLTIEHTPKKSASIAIFHDTKVFTRLKNDKQAFRSLGIPDDIIGDLENRLVDDIKCLTATRSDDAQNIFLTVVLLSEKSDVHGCMLSGLINSFGVRAREIDDKTLLSTCILHQGRRLGFRNRDSLSGEMAGLRDRCLAKLGGPDRK